MSNYYPNKKRKLDVEAYEDSDSDALVIDEGDSDSGELVINEGDSDSGELVIDEGDFDNDDFVNEAPMHLKQLKQANYGNDNFTFDEDMPPPEADSDSDALVIDEDYDSDDQQLSSDKDRPPLEDELPTDEEDYEDMPSLEDEKIALRNWKLDEEIKKRKLQEEMRRKKLEKEEMIRKRDEYYAENYTPEELKINPADYGFEVDFVDKNSESDEGMLPLEGDFDNDDSVIDEDRFEPAENKNMQYSNLPKNDAFDAQSNKARTPVDIKHSDQISLLDMPNNLPKPIAKYQLKHLSPLIIFNDSRIEVNKNFQGTGIDTNVLSEYYRINTNNHFVWTNKTVITPDTEVDDEIISEVYTDYKSLNYTSCNQDDPEKSFELRRKDNMGFGLYAKHDIPAGSVIGEYAGELITKKVFLDRFYFNVEHRITNYFYDTATSMTIDAGPMGNHTRFINHSCTKENCVAKSLTANEVTILAIKNIKRGEEILLNYGEGYFKHLTCLCKEEKCLENKKK